MEGKSEQGSEMRKGFDLGQAMAEAGRCLLCHDAPCSQGCPAGTDPAVFIRKLRFQNVTGAIRTIKRNNILGGTCGELCPTSRLCEQRCAAAGLDRPIQIGRIQRFLVEPGWRIGWNPLERAEARTAKVAVVGSGPAGLACAAELALSGVSVTIFEAREQAGGVLRYGVPAYRFAPDFLERELADVAALGVTIQCSSPIRGRAALEELLQQGFAAVFIAPGLWQPVRLDLGSIPPRGVYASTDFLGALRDGRSAELEREVRGRRVAVFGGGSVAIDCAESARHLGARDVYLVYRRSYAEMPAEEDEKVGALRAGLQLLVLNQPKAYLADAAGRLRAVVLARTELGEPDSSGRRDPIEGSGARWELPVEVAIEALGARPAADVMEWGEPLARATGGLIAAASESGSTSVERVYAGGDVVRGPALIVQAVRDGKVAAQSILRTLGAKGGAA
jgi:NADPH-dependent glutamate synthase beta subunit-like oxidoreductase